MSGEIWLLVLSTFAAEGGDRTALWTALSEMSAHEADVRSAGAKRAGELGSPLFVDPLRGLLAAPEPRVRAAAAIALGDIGVPATSEDLTHVLSALMSATRDADEGVAEAAMIALSRFPFPGVRERLSAVAMDSKLSSKRREAARTALLAPHNDEDAKRIERWLQVSRDEAIAAQRAPSASWTIAPEQRWGVEANDVLRRARDLLSPDTALHTDAVNAIATWGNKDESFPFLVRAAHEPEPAIRIRAVDALKANPRPEAERVIAGLLGDSVVNVRRAAIDALALRSSAFTATGLAKQLSVENEPALRARLVVSLQKQSDETLVTALGSVKPDDRYLNDAARVLGDRGSHPGSELLVHWLLEARGRW